MKPIASLSLDLDNKWSYMKTHGDPGWESYPSYLDVCVPRILDFLKMREMSITFFVVGQDASLEKNCEAFSQLAGAGHEIGNHSYNHEPWLHLYSKQELRDEFQKTEDAIQKATGCKTTGFRGPGYSLSPAVLEVLAERGYEYDCSMLPTFIGPFARAYYFLTAPKMNDDERAKRKILFGKFRDGFQALKPYRWEVGEKTIIEIPVTTLPIIKTPIHASYLLYLSTFSKTAARTYWKTALKMCRATGVEPSLLLHPLDFLSGEDVPELKFFPAMSLNIEKKLEFLSEILENYTREFLVVDLKTHASTVIKSNTVVRTSGDIGLKPELTDEE